MMVSLIVAATENGVIGRNGVMPWSMPSDLKFFRRMTMGKPVVMGRKTFESIGKPLPGRHNIVVSRTTGYAAVGVDVVSTLAEALARARETAIAVGMNEVMVIGGGQIYAAALPLAGRVYLTRIHTTLDGDATFPVLDPAQWHIVGQNPLPCSERDEFMAETVVFERFIHPKS
jgi:dihydrofolate reductase